MNTNEHIHNHGDECISTHGNHHAQDCDCGCNGEYTQAETIIENALIFSKTGELQLEYPITAEGALLSAVKRISRLADLLAVDDVISGHIKALLECAAGKASVSITRTDTSDITRYDGWSDNTVIDSCTLTINILSLANNDAIEDTNIIQTIFKNNRPSDRSSLRMCT